jgi:hypothetical protein
VTVAAKWATKTVVLQVATVVQDGSVGDDDIAQCWCIVRATFPHLCCQLACRSRSCLGECSMSVRPMRSAGQCCSGRRWHRVQFCACASDFSLHKMLRATFCTPKAVVAGLHNSHDQRMRVSVYFCHCMSGSSRKIARLQQP